MEDMLELEKDLLMDFGFGKFYNNDRSKIPEVNYRDMMKKYNTDEIKASHENLMVKDYGPVTLLKHFPVHTSPFWNMKTVDGHARKCDVIL